MLKQLTITQGYIMTIDYIDIMLHDSRLETKDKLECLDSFSKSVNDFVQNGGIIHSDKLKELAEISSYIKKQKEVLNNA